MAKGPKVVNPVDRARKDARKKEIQKNKKQREQVRLAAIQNNDPDNIIEELTKLDEQQFNIDSPEALRSEHLFKDKRKKLVSKYERILEFYLKEDAEKHSKLKAQMHDYESRHKKLATDFKGIVAANQIQINDVFLPPEHKALALPTIATINIVNKHDGPRLNSNPTNLRHGTHTSGPGPSVTGVTTPKPAVIESKPVLFKSKAKFVPSAVLLKLRKPGDGS